MKLFHSACTARIQNGIVALRRVGWWEVLFSLIPLLLYWITLYVGVPSSLSRLFHSYSAGLFVLVLVLFCLSFRLPDRFTRVITLSLVMLLLALSLSYRWTSGYSDNMIMGGLVPYKDGKNFYFGSNLILNGLAPVNANQATERPLFPGFLASVLFLTRQNLKIALAVLVQLAGLGIYLSARRVQVLAGTWSGGLFATFLYFYIQPYAGYAMSEVFGFSMGCLAFVLFLFSRKKNDWLELVLSGLLLMIAISARAGTFLIFPMLALWAGWVFRGNKRFSFGVFTLALFLVVAGYFLVNSLYSGVLGIPPGSTFGNFSYALYGQARGGAGWHSAIEDLGTRDPALVYRATWDMFLKHPLSLFLGFAKAYRDFFMIGESSIFPFGAPNLVNVPGIILWLGSMLLLVRGCIRLLRDFSSSLSALLIAGFLGIFFSVPFLPPIDGGARFYASSVPFFYAIPALGVVLTSKTRWMIGPVHGDREMPLGLSLFSILLIGMTIIMPPIFKQLNHPVETVPPICSSGEKPFVIQSRPESYIDLVKMEAEPCGMVPDVCYADFKANNTEKATDDFYQEIFTLMDNNTAGARIVPAIDWVEGKFHYFYIPHDMFTCTFSSCLLSGCASEIETTYQSVYKVELILQSSD